MREEEKERKKGKAEEGVFFFFFKYRVPGRTEFLPRGPNVEPADRVWSCCAQTCCQTRPGRGPRRSP